MNRIKELRLQKQIDQKELARNIQIGKGSVSNWEVGRTEPSIEYLFKLADYFEVSIDYLLGHSNETDTVVIKKDLTMEESELLNLFNQMSSQDKNQLLGFAKALVK